ncbi:2-C-methyl-D-erythritol 4-phosphate cytidylyltransferase [Treponema sp. R6D11]
MSKPNITAVLAAAGSGERLSGGEGKALDTLLGEPLIIHSIKIFEKIEEIAGVIISAREEDIIPMYDILKGYSFDKPIKIIPGGDERGESILNALKYVDTEKVLLHDAARPCVNYQTMMSAIEASADNNICVVSKIAGTIHKTSSDMLDETLNRDELFEAQTPQIFKTESLKQAYDKFGTSFTDDAGLVAKSGEQVQLIIGRTDNIKVTTPSDLDFAKAVLLARDEY